MRYVAIESFDIPVFGRIPGTILTTDRSETALNTVALLFFWHGICTYHNYVDGNWLKLYYF